MRTFISRSLLYIYLFMLPFSVGAGEAFLLEFSDLNIPDQHKVFIRKILIEKEDECAKFGDFTIELNPFAISRLLISDDGTEATIFSPILNCEGLNLWNSSSGFSTFFLVENEVFKGWFTALPERIIVEGHISILLSLDATECTSASRISNSIQNCFVLLRWISEEKQFYGSTMPLMSLGTLRD